MLKKNRFHKLSYTSRDLIKEAKRLGYDVVALTFTGRSLKALNLIKLMHMPSV